MNILIGGVCRSGTTRLFNCVRLIGLQNFSEEQIQANHHTRIIKNSFHKINICKTHVYTKEWSDWSDLIFSTKRNMLGVAASCLDQMFRLNRDLKIFTKHFEEGFIEHYKGWLGNSDLEIEYEKWDQQKEDNIKKISQFMGLKSDSHLIIETLEYYKTNTMLDANTLMLPNHISKNSDKDIKDRLSKTEYDHFYTLFKKHNIEV